MVKTSRIDPAVPDKKAGLVANAGKSRNLNDENPVGAWLAREECTAVFQVLRVIVLRGQATLPQVLRLNLPACYGGTSDRGRGWYRIQLSTHFTYQVSDRVGVAQNGVDSHVHIPWIQKGIASSIHRCTTRCFQNFPTHMP
ncbi:hypothetical protein AB7M22_002086 [Pseudomonas sp. ADAK2 TE3594]